MSPTDILPFVTGAGGALFVLLCAVALFVTDKIMAVSAHKREMTAKDAVIEDKNKQIEYYQRAVELERNRNEVSDLAAKTATSVLKAMHEEAKVQ